MDINGTSGDDALNGTPGDDTINGLAGNDTINPDSGADAVNGGDGDDTIIFGAQFGAGDSVNGGLGNDELRLQGNYVGTNAITNPTLTGIETISVLGGFNYDIRVRNSNVSASGVMSVVGTALQSGNALAFNASEVTSGSFRFYGGLGAEYYTGGSGDDVFYFAPGQFGPGGSGPYFRSDAHLDGGLGIDRIVFDGSQAVSLLETNVRGIEMIELRRGAETALNTYTIVPYNVVLAAGQTLTISGAQLGTPLTFYSLEIPSYALGHYRIYGGAAADSLRSGAGSDWFHGGGGADTININGTLDYSGAADTIAYTAVADSTPAARDSIQGFESGDKVDISAIDAVAGSSAYDAFVWSVDENFHHIAGELRFMPTSAATGLLEGDTNGDGSADLSIALTFVHGHVFDRSDVVIDKPGTLDIYFDAPELWVDHPLDYSALHIGDFNGDGADDLYDLSGGSTIYIADRARHVFHEGDASSWDLPAGQRYSIGDFNGDGLDDAFRYIPGVGSEMHLSTGTTFEDSGVWTEAWRGDDDWYVGDFNGDGRDDIFRYLYGTSGADMFLSDGAKFITDGSWTSAGKGARGWFTGDFNGDGKDDVFRYIPGESGADMWLSTGSGFAHSGSWTSAEPGAENWYVGDFNGDGMDDIFRYLEGQSGADVFLSTGAAFVRDGNWTGAGHGPGFWSIGDFNGDGSSDLLRVVSGGLDILL